MRMLSFLLWCSRLWVCCFYTQPVSCGMMTKGYHTEFEEWHWWHMESIKWTLDTNMYTVLQWGSFPPTEVACAVSIINPKIMQKGGADDIWKVSIEPQTLRYVIVCMAVSLYRKLCELFLLQYLNQVIIPKGDSYWPEPLTFKHVQKLFPPNIRLNLLFLLSAI